MPQFIWFNQPTNHSGTVNFLFLDPDGEIGQFTMYMADGGGPYILGGPELFDFRDDATVAALILISLMPAGIRIFPPKSEKAIRASLKKPSTKIREGSSPFDEDDWQFRVFSPSHTPQECREFLLKKTQPKSAVVFIDKDNQGDLLLALELARIYYRLPHEERKRLKLGPDWRHHLDT
jgi:prepilin-type processing-associated H-X9-DG protein